MTVIGFFDSCHLFGAQGVVRCEVESFFLVVATFYTKKNITEMPESLSISNPSVKNVC